MLPELLSGYSKALYSSWLHYRPDRLLVDCGEGAASAMGNNCFAIERVLLTHGHIDHIAGLPALLWARAGGMGDNEKPLHIFYPRGDAFVGDMRQYIEKTGERLTFALEWHELEVGQRLELRRGRSIETFATRHMKESPSLGYKIIEVRRRRKAEFAHLSEAEMRALSQSGEMENITEEYEAIKIAFGGDSLPIEPHIVQDCEILVHEATILDAADRKGQSHSTMGETLDVALKAQPKTLLVNHTSGRYKRAEIETAIQQGAAKREIRFPIWCLRQNQLWQVWNPPLNSESS